MHIDYMSQYKIRIPGIHRALNESKGKKLEFTQHYLEGKDEMLEATVLNLQNI
jgi:hypothetical protein